MSVSYTLSESATFTLTHAKHLAAKVATDLKRVQRFYGAPSDIEILRYEEEVTLLLRGGYVASVTYGFKRNGEWIEPALRYTVRDLVAGTVEDNDPGRVRPGADVSNAAFASFLVYSSSWHSLSAAQREAFEKQLPFRRSTGPEPGISGRMESDRTYTAAGRALERASVRTP